MIIFYYLINNDYRPGHYIIRGLVIIYNIDVVTILNMYLFF